MTVVVQVTRDTDYCGEPIREQYKITVEGEATCRLRVLPEEGSKALCVFNDVDIAELPGEVKKRVREQLKSVPEAL